MSIRELHFLLIFILSIFKIIWLRINEYANIFYQALELGNRTLMMDAGRIVFDVKGEARSKMTVDDLLEKFRENAGKVLDNDRILLSKVEANN